MAKDAPKLIFGEPDGPEPLLVLDGKVVTQEQVKALDQSTIDHINVLKYSEDKKDLLRVYGNKFNADTSNGIIFIVTKEYAKSDERKKDYVVVVHSKDKKAAKENTPTATGTFTPTATGSFSPNTSADGDVFNVVEHMPEFPGGTGELMKYLSMNVRYPEAAHKAGTQGRVMVSFIVEPDGTISNAHVQKGVSAELDQEALRVIKSMPKWKPGMQSGKAVRVKYTIPISFRLNSPKEEE